jgi:hypothetical protein
VVEQNKKGRTCDNATDCLPGDGACLPITTTATTTKIATTTVLVTTLTITTATDTNTTATTTPITTTLNTDAATVVVQTKYNVGGVSCDDYCEYGINEEAVVGSTCTAAVRGQAETPLPPPACTARVDGPIVGSTNMSLCMQCGSSGSEPTTCWCAPPPPPAPPSADQPAPSGATPPSPMTKPPSPSPLLGATEPLPPPPTFVLDLPSWEAAPLFGTVLVLDQVSPGLVFRTNEFTAAVLEDAIDSPLT